MTDTKTNVPTWNEPEVNNIPDYPVLCCDEWGDMMVGTLYEETGSDCFSAEDDCFRVMFNVIAWMELPDLPTNL